MLLGLKSIAQDPFLSMEQMAAQFMSPAAVGNGIYGQRLQTNLRAQFVNGNNLYHTIASGWDTRFKNKNPDKSSIIGIGFQIVSDQLMNGILQSNNISMNLSNRIYLDDYGYSSVAIGIGANYSQIYLDRTKLIFGDQFDYKAIASGTTAESVNATSNRFSGNMGFLYTYHSEAVFAQGSGNAIYNSKGNLINTIDNTSTVLKPNFFINFEKALDNEFTIAGHASYAVKYGNVQKVIGGAVGIPVIDKEQTTRRVYIGLYSRLGDAIIPSFSLMMDKYIFSLSYDIYQNSLTTANLKPNGFELSLSVSFGEKKNNFLRTIFN